MRVQGGDTTFRVAVNMLSQAVPVGAGVPLVEAFAHPMLDGVLHVPTDSPHCRVGRGAAS